MGITLPSTWLLQIVSGQPTPLNSLQASWRDAGAGVLSVDTKLFGYDSPNSSLWLISSPWCRLIYKSPIKWEVNWPAKVKMTTFYCGSVEGKVWQQISGFTADEPSILWSGEKAQTLLPTNCLKKENTFVLGRVMFIGLFVCPLVCLCLEKGQRQAVTWLFCVSEDGHEGITSQLRISNLWD